MHILVVKSFSIGIVCNAQAYTSLLSTGLDKILIPVISRLYLLKS